MSAEVMALEAPKLTRKDFTSDQMVRWCPGCGDYSILAQVQKIFPEFSVPKEKFVFISGIGCSSRFPYYMDTYGFHTIHGRAPAIATGVKLANPELSVWIVSGDGDSLSIGGNHFIHLLRRNLNINLMVFNNRIYGLTKGQYSPTTEKGKVTKSSPYGSLDHPFNPPALALGAASTFIARSIDVDAKHMQKMIVEAYKHEGTSFLEIYQNCLIFNDNAFDAYTDKETKGIRRILLEHGEPMLFGKDNSLGIRMDGHRPQVVDLTTGEWSADDMVVHDKTDRFLALMLCDLTYQPELPTPFGVIYEVEKVSYEKQVYQQIEDAVTKLGRGDLEKMLMSGHTWEVD